MRGATKEGKAEAAAAKKQAKQDKKDREAAMHAEEEAKRAKKERIAAKTRDFHFLAVMTTSSSLSH